MYRALNVYFGPGGKTMPAWAAAAPAGTLVLVGLIFPTSERIAMDVIFVDHAHSQKNSAKTLRQAIAIGLGISIYSVVKQMTSQLDNRISAQHWTIGRLLARIIEVLRQKGPRALWFKILGETVYRRLLLVERSLREPIPDVTPRLAVTIALLERSEIDDYLAFRAGTPLAEVQRRLDAGHRCFIARYQGCFAATIWAATTRAWSHYLSFEFPIAPDEIYVYDSFALPDLRGQGITRSLGIAMLHDFRAAGYRRVSTAVFPENRASVQVVAKNGWRACGLMGYLKLGPWRYGFYKKYVDPIPIRR